MRQVFSKAAHIYRRLLEPSLFVPDLQRDIFLITYPRSGTTWISCIATELMFGRKVDNFNELTKFIPSVHNMPKKSSVPASKQYLISSHLPYIVSPTNDRYSRVIYLLRDPRDVLFSYHRYLSTFSGYTGDIRIFASDWVTGRIWPCSWQDHVNSWIGSRAAAAPFELTILRYEEFAADPVGMSTRFAKILGVSLPLAQIEDIVANNNAKTMRERESRTISRAAESSGFIGPAVSGAWKENLQGPAREAVEIIEEYAGRTMERLGYCPDRTCGATSKRS